MMERKTEKVYSSITVLFTAHCCTKNVLFSNSFKKKNAEQMKNTYF